jgi:hypothetical protein
VLPPDVFEHPDRHEGVVGSADVAVIVFDELDPVFESLLAGPPARIFELFAGNVEGPHP